MVNGAPSISRGTIIFLKCKGYTESPFHNKMYKNYTHNNKLSLSLSIFYFLTSRSKCFLNCALNNLQERERERENNTYFSSLFSCFFISLLIWLFSRNGRQKSFSNTGEKTSQQSNHETYGKASIERVWRPFCRRGRTTGPTQSIFSHLNLVKRWWNIGSETLFTILFVSCVNNDAIDIKFSKIIGLSPCVKPALIFK